MSDRPRSGGEQQTGPFNALKVALVVAEWQPVAAVHGTGSMLVGPHPAGAQALIPPAVITRTPTSSAEAHSDAGWRLGTWSMDDIERSHVAAAPISLETISLLDSVQLVQQDAPNHRGWLENQIALRATCLSVLLTSYVDADAAELSWLREELDDLMLDCTSVFGGGWTRALAAQL
jgi:hypothetical protein